MATGAAAALSSASPHASPAEAIDMLYVQQLHPARAGAPAQPQVQVGIAGQLVLMQAGQREAVAHDAAVAAARAVAARASAARVAAARLAARQAAARRAAERAAALAAQRAAERAAAARAAQQAAQRQSVTLQEAGGQGGQQASSPVTAPAAPAVSGSPQEIAQQLLSQYGWAGQFSCLDSLWERESGWNPDAENPSSGAFGIPQALPAAKMSSAGGDWATDAATQIRWGLSYIQSTYGSPCGAWAHEEASGWY